MIEGYCCENLDIWDFLIECEQCCKIPDIWDTYMFKRFVYQCSHQVAPWSAESITTIQIAPFIKQKERLL